MRDFLNGLNKKYLNIVSFVFLELIAFVLYYYNNEYPRSVWFSSANKFIAVQFAAQNKISDYFSVMHDNERLINENRALYERLMNLQMVKKEESVPLDTMIYPRYRSIAARIVNKTRHARHNYLTIDRGEVDGVRKNMWVGNIDGLVGVIKLVGTHYSIVTPLNHSDIRVSCRLSHNRYIGTVQWNGKHDNIGVLSDISTHVKVTEGDTVVTSGLSSIYPADILVGKVIKVEQRNGVPYQNITIAFFADFDNIEHVYVVEEALKVEQAQLEKNVG